MKSTRTLLIAALAIGAAATAVAQDRRGYGQDPYYRNGPYDNRGGSYGGYARGGPAAQFGFEDGRRDGQRDSFQRRGFRPEKNGSFKDADHGYQRQFGDKRYYKERYRAAYMEGYRMAFRSGDYRGDRRW